MSDLCLTRRFALAAAIGIAGACLMLPAIADPATTVTFQANNPWTQEIGTVSHSDHSHEYTVAVAADKTLQINLVTRNPNVYFVVKNDSKGEQLVDTRETGATTWSTPNATAATYTIRVYVDPATIRSGESAKYALQVGQYGAADMQAASTEVTFKDNQPWAQVVGKVDAAAPAHDYPVAIAAGMTLQVNLITKDSRVHFKVEDEHHDKVLFDSATAGTNTWSTPVAVAATYDIHVYVDPAGMPPGRAVGYALQVGHFPGQGAQPAAPGTTASPAQAASAGGADG